MTKYQNKISASASTLRDPIFADLPVGGLFRYPTSDKDQVYMRIENNQAVQLASGSVFYPENKQTVVPILTAVTITPQS